MGKVKYNEEMKLQTVKYVLEGGKSATKVAKELGIDTNTVCRWEWKIRRIMRENGFIPKRGRIEGSMSEPGCPYDNSCGESFFATLKKEIDPIAR